MGSQALVDLLGPFLRLSLLRQCPASHHSTNRPPARKSLFRGEADGGFCALLGSTHLAAELMEHGSKAQSKTQAKEVRILLRQRYRLLAPSQPLVRIPQRPQRPRGKDVTHHTSVFPIKECRGAVLLGVIERHTLCKVRVRLGWCAQAEQRRSQGTVRRHQHG